jgi:mRNA-degrading endonuclease toxin of MazEF toxin-antitoxin module
MPLRPGDIYWANMIDGSRRPIVVVSGDELNRGTTVVGIGFTSARLELRRGLANCVPFRAWQFGLTKDCVAQAESIASIDLGHLEVHAGPMGRLDSRAMRNLIRAIGYVIAAECEPA